MAKSKKVNDYAFIHLGECIHVSVIKDFLRKKSSDLRRRIKKSRILFVEIRHFTFSRRVFPGFH